MKKLQMETQTYRRYLHCKSQNEKSENLCDWSIKEIKAGIEAKRVKFENHSEEEPENH